MYYISARDNLDNEDTLSTSDSYWRIRVENQVERQREEITVDDLRSFAADEHVLVLVHGYNNEFEDIVRAYDIIEAKVDQHLGDYYDAVIGYTWPGGDHAWEWYSAKRRAGVVAPRLANLLQLLADETEAVDVMTHSLGARCALSGMNNLPAGTIRAQYLLASAVDNESIEVGEKYHRATQRVGESVVFYTKHDSVLRYAYSSAEWDYALGYTGPEDSAGLDESVTVANCKRVVDSHGGYKTEDAIYAFIARWLNGEIGEQFVTL